MLGSGPEPDDSGFLLTKVSQLSPPAANASDSHETSLSKATQPLLCAVPQIVRCRGFSDKILAFYIQCERSSIDLHLPTSRICQRDRRRQFSIAIHFEPLWKGTSRAGCS